VINHSYKSSTYIFSHKLKAVRFNVLEDKILWLEEILGCFRAWNIISLPDEVCVLFLNNKLLWTFCNGNLHGIVFVVFLEIFFYVTILCFLKISNIQ